jgi:hypothetical protein
MDLDSIEPLFAVVCARDQVADTQHAQRKTLQVLLVTAGRIPFRVVVSRSEDKDSILVAPFLNQQHAGRSHEIAGFTSFLQRRQPDGIGGEIIAQRAFVPGHRLDIEDREVFRPVFGWTHDSVFQALSNAKVGDAIQPGETLVSGTVPVFHTGDPFEGLQIAVVR